MTDASTSLTVRDQPLTPPTTLDTALTALVWVAAFLGLALYLAGRYLPALPHG